MANEVKIVVTGQNKASAPLKEALSDVQKIRVAVEKIPDTKTIKVTVKDDATAVVEKVSKQTPKPIEVPVEAKTGKAESDIQGLEGKKVSVPVEADTGKAQSDIKGLQGKKVTVPVEAETSGARQALQGLGDLGTDVGDSFSGGLASGMKAGIAGGIAAVGGALVAGIADEISASKAIERSLKMKFKVDPAIAKEYADLFDTDFAEGITDWISGGSLDEGVKALSDAGVEASDLAATAVILKQNFKEFGGLAKDDMRALTVEMASVAQRGGVDVVQAIKGAEMASIKWGLSAWDATRLVGRGFDEMGPRGDDWAETLQEYAGYFQAMGLSADDTFNLISQAMKGGARDTDYAADVFKEFGIRVIEGSAETSGALKRLGLDAGAMAQTIANGGPPAKQALDTIIDRLRAMQDPVERNRLGVALFGTQWEDTFKNVIGSTDLAVGSVYAFNRSVMEAAMAANGNGDPALRKMIGSMTNAQLQAEGATVRFDNLGRKIVTLPNGKEITVTAKDLASNTITNIAGRSYSAVIKLYGQFAGYYGLPNGVVLSGSSARGNAAGGAVVGHAAEGGPRGGLTRVNEQGPELMRTQRGALIDAVGGQTVVPAGQSAMIAAAAAGGGGGGVGGGPITINLVLDRRVLGTATVDALRERARSQAGGDITRLLRGTA